MWPVVVLLRTYAPYVTLPIAAVIGFIGYNVEKHFRTPPPNRPSVEEERTNRLIQDVISGDSGRDKSLMSKDFVPKTIFERNISPGLLDGKNEKP